MSLNPCDHRHTYYYDSPGHSYQDLSWACMMWLGASGRAVILREPETDSVHILLAPYIAILLTSTGVLYGVLVAPTALADIRRTREDTLLPPQAPLAGLPCWVLNTFIFLAPTLVIVSILVPATMLVEAVKQGEQLARTYAGQHEMDRILTKFAAQIKLLEVWLHMLCCMIKTLLPACQSKPHFSR